MNSADEKNIEIKFGGDLHEISADVLIESLVSYSLVAQQTSAYLSPGIQVEIKIMAPQKGSFLLLLKLIAQHGHNLFTADNLQIAADIVVTVGGLYGLRKWIANKGIPKVVKPLNDDSIEITNNNGSIVINKNVYNIYQENPSVRENLRKTFSKLKEQEEIESFSIKDIEADKEIFIAEKEDFHALASAEDDMEQRKQTVVREHQELSVFKIVFQPNYKWEFYYLGIKIYASIKDTDFFKNIESGAIAFRSGDKLVVDLEIEQVFNESANTFVNESYFIQKVIEHIPRQSSTQQSIDFEP